MSEPFSDLQGKLELSLAACINALPLHQRGGAVAVPSANDDEALLPRIVCTAGVGNEEPAGAGNYYISLEAHVYTSFRDNTRLDHRTRCGYVYDEMFSGTLAANLSNYTDLHVFGISSRQVLPEVLEKDGVNSGVQLQAYACGMDITT